MKKYKKILIILITIIITLILLIITFKNVSKYKGNKRYEEIRESIRKGLEWQDEATTNNVCTGTATEITKDWYLVSNGYIKQEDLLDVDKKSYCKAVIVTHCEKNKYVHKIYLKCKNYVDDGYTEDIEKIK